MVAIPRVEGSLGRVWWYEGHVVERCCRVVCLSEGGLVQLLQVNGAPRGSVFLRGDHHARAPGCLGALWYWLDYAQFNVPVKAFLYLFFPIVWYGYRSVRSVGCCPFSEADSIDNYLVLAYSYTAQKG